MKTPLPETPSTQNQGSNVARPRQRPIRKLTATLGILLSLVSIQAKASSSCPVPSFTTVNSAYNVYFGGAIASAIGDVNGDGKPDLTFVYSVGYKGGWDSHISVLLGNGDGSFQSPTGNFGVRNNPSKSLVIGDLNGDGKSDLATDNGVLLGNEDGSFQPTIDFSAGVGFALTIGDFNGDAKPDLASIAGAGKGAGYVMVQLGNGDGSFQPRLDFSIGAEPEYMKVGDVNSDGKLDIVTENGSDTQTVLVLLGNGDGTFQPFATYQGDRGSPLMMGNVNIDGKPDLVVGNMTLFGNGDGTFRSFASLSDIHYHTMGDLNGDGKPDLVGYKSLPDGTVVQLGNGDGSFQPASYFNSNFYTSPDKVVDVNGDGKLDIIGSGFYGQLSVLLNTCGVNQPPTISGNNLTRPQDSTARLPIAIVNDAEDAKNTLHVTATQNSGSGVSLTNIGVDASGNVTATVATSCAAIASVFTLNVTDSGGLSALDGITVTITPEQTPPILTLKPDLLVWPPNYVYTSLSMMQLLQSAADNCSTPNVLIESVSSDEADNIAGDSDGNTVNDIVLAADCKSLQVRAERDSLLNGRVYGVTLRAKDSVGNVVRKILKVSVPISQNITALQDVPVQIKTCTLP